MDELSNIYGIGPVAAEKILKHGIAGKKINPKKPIRAQLRKASIFPHLPAATRADLKYNPNRRIPHNVIIELEKELKKRLKGIKFTIAGSYRRKKSYSRDVDIVVSAPSNHTAEYYWNRFMSRLKNSKITLYPAYAIGADKASTMMRILHGSRRYTIKVDVFFTPPKEYMFMLLYATGSGQFNIRMRSQAKRLGYLLNQHGLYKRISDNMLKRVPVKNERDLFKKLNMKYLLPHQRKK